MKEKYSYSLTENMLFMMDPKTKKRHYTPATEANYYVAKEYILKKQINKAWATMTQTYEKIICRDGKILDKGPVKKAEIIQEGYWQEDDVTVITKNNKQLDKVLKENHLKVVKETPNTYIIIPFNNNEYCPNVESPKDLKIIYKGKIITNKKFACYACKNRLNGLLETCEDRGIRFAEPEKHKEAKIPERTVIIRKD